MAFLVELSSYDLLGNYKSKYKPTFPIYMIYVIIISTLFWHFIYEFMESYLKDKKYSKSKIDKYVGRVIPFLHSIFATFTSIYILLFVEPLLRVPKSYVKPIKHVQYIISISYGI